MTKKFKIDNFWRWDDFRSYVDVSGLFLAFFTVLTLMLYNSSLYVESIGFLSVMIESVVGLPQILANRKNKSTEGLSIGLIGTWFAGDAAKTLFFIFKSQPIQFVLCGITQLSIDIYILSQIYIYGKRKQSSIEAPKHVEMV